MTIPSTELISKVCNEMRGDKDIEICFKEKYNTLRYYFNQIGKIDEIRVTVSMLTKKNSNLKYFTKWKIIGMNIKTKEPLYTSNMFYDNDFNISVNNCITNLYKILPNLKLNKYDGCLYTPENFIDEELGNTYQWGTECSVCLDKTLTQLRCNHYLCVHCWNQIVNYSNTNMKCPLCREDIIDNDDYSGYDTDN
jgi:hypothetical protein